MDSNASKNTNSHKFSKLWFNYEKPAISIKNLLKQELLSVLNLNRQSLSFPLNFESLDTLIDRQLILLSLERQQFLIQSNNWHLLDMPAIPLCYSCPIGFILAPRLQISPQKVVEDLANLFDRHDSSTANLPLYIDPDPTGWLNFHVTETAIASWLERSLWLLKTQEDNSLLTQKSDRYMQQTESPLLNGADGMSLRKESQRGDPLVLRQNLSAPPKTSLYRSSDLFCVQYIHARCCSLLRLGAREQLISLVDNDFNHVGWQLTQPESISWIDRQHHLWFNRSEYNLLRQLLIVTDSQTANDSSKWSKLALDLSQSTAIFLADCRFLGEIKEQSPQRAIARLGLIALAQYWLHKILIEKLNIIAPTTL